MKYFNIILLIVTLIEFVSSFQINILKENVPYFNSTFINEV